MMSALYCTRRTFSSAPVMMGKLSPEDCWDILRASKVICFDVDSTVSSEEGIDELADFLGKGPAVTELTNQAMGGGMLFHDALQARLDIMHPSRQNISDMLETQPPQLSPGIADLFKALRNHNKEIYLVSGGFRPLINPMAEKLDVAVPTNIYANEFLFNNDGTYRDFDRSEPTSRAGGKAKAVASIKAKHGGCKVVMIGDGMTDVEAKYEEGGADLVIGFGGIVTREAVKEAADIFVTDFKEISEQLS